MALYRKTTPSSYPDTNPNNFTDASKNWRKHSNMYRKTSGSETASLTAVPGRYTDSTRTWRRIRAMYRFNGSVWQRIFYKNANQPFATESPTIRYNAYLGTIVDTTYTDATEWWATDPYQPQWAQMGPGPLGIGQSTWYLDSSDNEVGASNPTYLWGRDGLWANDTGASTSATFAYNTEIYAAGATNSTDDEGNYQGDKLRNNQSVMGTYDGYYIWYKISKTVGTYTGTGFSQAVYVTKQEPKMNSFVMSTPGVAIVGTPKTVTYSFSNKWWRDIDRYSSYIEWHELSYSTQTPDSSTLKATHPIYSTTYVTDNATTFTGTDSYTPVGSNKYVYAKIVYKNTWTEFPPVTAKYAEVVTTVATQQACGPFTLSNATKTGRYFDSGTATYKRQVSVQIGKSEGADRYELQIRGYGPNVNGEYSFPLYSGYTTLLTYDDSPYTMESNRSGGTLTATANVSDYQYYEITARAKFGSTTDGSVISTNTLYPPEVAPSAPIISSIATATDSFGTYITANISQTSVGSNIEKEYQYSLNGGSFSSVSSGTYGTLGTGYINVANGVKLYVNEATLYSLQIRLKNYDDAISASSNSLSITSASKPGVPTSVVLKSFSPFTGHIFFTSGANTGSVKGTLEYDFTFSATDYIQSSINIASNTAGVIAITGGNSQTRSYSAFLIPYGSSNLTGNQGTISSFGSKVLSGGDNPTATFGTPTKGTNGAYDLNFSWTAGGSSNKYTVDLIQYNSPYSIISTKTTTSTSISFSSADTVQPNTTYYARITPMYEYATGVSYSGTTSVSSNITTNALAATAPTSVTAANNGSANSVTVSWSGASNAIKYRIFWNSNGVVPAGGAASNWDEEKVVDGSTITSSAGSWTWGPSDTDKNGNLPTGRNAQYFMVSATSDGSTWTTYVVTSGKAGPYILPVNTAIPTLTGTAKRGQTVTYGPGTWDVYPTDYAIELYRGTQFVARSETRVANTTKTATDNPLTATYTVTADDVGKYLRTFATATNYAGTSGWAPGTEIGPVTNLTLYTVTFDANSGSSTPSAVSQTTEGGSVTLAAAITRTGYTFGGWNTKSDGTGTNSSASSSYTPASNITLYAKWTANVSLPTNSSAPTLTGTAQVTKVLTFGVGTWTGSPTSYSLQLYRGTQFVARSETQLKDAGNVSSSTYTLVAADQGGYVRSFASATNAAGTTGYAAGAELGPVAAAPAGGSAPVLSTLTANNSLTLGGTFSWSYSGSPTGYSIFCQGPTGSVFTTNNAYTYTGTTFRPGYDGSGWQGAGNYTLYVSARNASGTSVVSSLTWSMS